MFYVIEQADLLIKRTIYVMFVKMLRNVMRPARECMGEGCLGYRMKDDEWNCESAARLHLNEDKHVRRAMQALVTVKSQAMSRQGVGRQMFHCGMTSSATAVRRNRGRL